MELSNLNGMQPPSESGVLCFTVDYFTRRDPRLALPFAAEILFFYAFIFRLLCREFISHVF